MKGPSEKSFDGIYSNQLFVHASASLIGCIVHLQVKNGDIYQGVFRTFSHKMDIALEMAQKLDGKKSNNLGNPVSVMLSTPYNQKDYTEKLIFRAEDVVHVAALNTDTDFATGETFTDTAISKFNGQVQQRELEPWDGGETSVDGLGGLGTECEESNGWDAAEMFRTNEEKYGVKSSFDSELPGYTIPLEKKNTEEYKQQEAKAIKIAQMIESGVFHRSRNALENGDEEDRFSAVVRPERNAIETRKTEGSKHPEAKASKIVPENEIGYCLQSRNALQNGYEKRFTSYSRVNGARYQSSSRKKIPQGMRTVRSSPSPSTHPGNRNTNHSFQHQQSQPHRVSSPATSAPPSGYKTASSTSSTSCVSTPSPRPTPSSTPTPRHTTAAPQIIPPPTQQQHPLPAQLTQPPPQAASPSSTSAVGSVANNQSPAASQCLDDHKVNGVTEMEKVEQKPHREAEPKPLREEPKPPREMEKAPRDMEPKPPRDMEPKPPRDMEPKPPRLSNQQTNVSRETGNLPPTNQAVIASNKVTDRRKDGEKKMPSQKARDDKTEDLKRFHEKFKLSDDKESKEHKEEGQKLEASTVSSAAATSAPKQLVTKEKEKPKEEDKKVESVSSEEVDAVNEAIKASSLNPNAKEFVLNPNAKAFTPRAVPVPSNVAPPPPPLQPPPRLHTQSPVVAVPQPHLLPGVPQPIFANMGPHYVVSATPVSVPLGSPFNPPSSIQAPRYRREICHCENCVFFSAVPMTIQQRHEMSQSVHVQAATGPPILAQPTLSTPQFAIQYAPSPGMIHPQGPPQTAIGYTQMYSVMAPPRVLNPQAVGIVPTSSYGESPHVPAHLYMPHPGTPNVTHVPPGNTGQHSSSSTPQSQTPALHPAPSPVHQPPPSGPHGSHGQPPTPTGHPGNAPTPQPVIYHGHITSQHPVHGNPPTANQTHPYPASFPGTPQPIMLLPQQVSGAHAPHPATFSSSLQNHLLHGQTPGNHAGTPPTHVLPHPPMAMIPTSAAMVHTQSMQSGHFAPHTQDANLYGRLGQTEKQVYCHYASVTGRRGQYVMQ